MKITYRPEIDGLRAIAVLAVVFFHAGFGFPGGFVGVDVFFVISGFLITRIILKDIGQSGASFLKDFWLRRIRRILPAGMVMVLIVLIIGYFVLDRLAYQGLAKSAIAQAFLGANVYFWKDIGYFAEAADFKPLLHTWSLAVEEQFYLFFPFLFVLGIRKKFGRQFLAMLVTFVGFLSFCLSIYLTRTNPEAAFFLIPTRAWELSLGAIVAFLPNRKLMRAGIAEFCATIGLIFIAIAVFSFDSTTPFPGWHASVPVLGAAIFIFANLQCKTVAGRFLSWKPLVFVGLISYSLYLWHWPFLVYGRMVAVDFGWQVRLIAVVLSFIFAYLSWRWIETPFRKGSLLKKPSMALTFGITSTLFTAGCAYLVIIFPGVQRFDIFERRMLEDIQ